MRLGNKERMIIVIMITQRLTNICCGEKFISFYFFSIHGNETSQEINVLDFGKRIGLNNLLQGLTHVMFVPMRKTKIIIICNNAVIQNHPYLEFVIIIPGILLLLSILARVMLHHRAQ